MAADASAATAAAAAGGRHISLFFPTMTQALVKACYILSHEGVGTGYLNSVQGMLPRVLLSHSRTHGTHGRWRLAVSCGKISQLLCRPPNSSSCLSGQEPPHLGSPYSNTGKLHGMSETCSGVGVVWGDMSR